MRKLSAEKDESHMTNAETNTAATVSEQGPHVAPARAQRKKRATQKKGAPQGAKAAKGAKPKKAAQKSKRTAKPKRKATAPRAESKSAEILALIRRPKGATLAELVKATGWQNHSIRGFLSGAVGKKMRLTVVSQKREDGERVYSIKK